MTDYDENKVITKEMLKSGIKAKLVTFAEDLNENTEDCFDTSLEELFEDVVYELRGVDLNAEK